MRNGERRKRGNIRIAALAMLSGLFLSGCGPAVRTNEIRIGIIQLSEYAIFDRTRYGFLDGLAMIGYQADETVQWDYRNAQGEEEQLQLFAQEMVEKGYDLILAISLPAAKAAANATKEIPILATASGDLAALGLVESNQNPGGNITGISDRTPVSAQITLAKQIVPEAVTIGLLHNPNDPVSQLQIEAARITAQEMGLKTVEAKATTLTEIEPATRSLLDKCQAMYVPTSNLMASGMNRIIEITEPAGLPVVTGEQSMVDQGGIATYSIDYYEVGMKAALIAERILTYDMEPKNMPVNNMTHSDLILNLEVSARIGRTFPLELLEKIN